METFCSTSCHEMEVNVYQEYMDTNHYVNRTGVRATCPDCHVPKEGIAKFVRKLQARVERSITTCWAPSIPPRNSTPSE